MRGVLVRLLVLPAVAGVPPHTPPVTDLANVLDAGQESELISVINDGAADGTVALEVLTVDRMSDWGVGGGDVESFARAVFDSWGIGDPVANDGALIVVAVEDREARIELGAGFDGAYDAAMTTVMSEVMLPRFRNGDYGDGIVEGARRVVARLGEAPDVASRPEEPETRPATPRTDLGDSSDGSGGVPWGGLGLGAGGVAVAGGLVVRSRRPKKCPRCSTACALVGEADDDVLLDDGQRAEEYLRSVDYRAWKCPSCSNVEITRHQRWFSRWKRCDGCGYRTARSSRRTISKATYSSTGLAVVTTECHRKECDHRSERRVTLPRLQHSSSSPSSAFGGHGFSGGGHSSSGGHSSGGRSGGGGASGSW